MGLFRNIVPIQIPFSKHQLAHHVQYDLLEIDNFGYYLL